MTESEQPKHESQPIADGLVHGPEALAEAFAALLHTARREVRLFAPHVEPAVFSTTIVSDAISRFVTHHPRNRLLLLTEDKTHLLRDNGRLVDLARRLSDGVEFREVGETEHGARDLYLIVDRTAHLVQEDIGRHDGVVATRAPHATNKLIERFDSAWDRASSIALRTLGL